MIDRQTTDNINRECFLNIENIKRSTEDAEWHPLIPFLPENAHVLFLGSFPPQRKRWCMDFFYPNFINDHWRIEGEIFFNDKNHFVDTANKTFKLDEITKFLREKGIALYDTAEAVKRLQDNASDKFLEIVHPTDINGLMQTIPHCEAIVTTGQKATETLCSSLGLTAIPKVGTSINAGNLKTIEGKQVRIFRLPSSSRAYPLSLEKKVEAYRKMFHEVGML